jgi:hypothetical protein
MPTIKLVGFFLAFLRKAAGREAAKNQEIFSIFYFQSFLILVKMLALQVYN